MVHRTYYPKSASTENLYVPTEKGLLYNIRNWQRIADAAPTSQKRRHAEDHISVLEQRLMHLHEVEDMRDDVGPQVELEPGHELPSMRKGAPEPMRGSKR